MLGVMICSCKKDNNTPANPLNGKTTAVFNQGLTYGILTDIDGNEYKTIKIGNQTWMAENLRTFKYNDGTPIQCVTNNDEWSGLTTGAYCTYNNTTKNDSLATFGCLYNWYAVNTSKLAPKGWHIPTKDDWETLVEYFGGEYEAGIKLMEAGQTHWLSSGIIKTNESGFTALPAGMLSFSNGKFNGCGSSTYFWMDELTAQTLVINYNDGIVYYFNQNKQNGFSARCIKD